MYKKSLHINNIRWRYILFILFSLLFAVSALADTGRRGGNDILNVSTKQPDYSIALWMDIFEDREGNIEINDILYKGGIDFRVNNRKSINLGITSSVFWLKFQICKGLEPGESQMSSLVRILSLGEAFKDRINWELYNSKGVLMVSGGYRGNRKTYAQINVTPRIETYYLKIQSTTSLLMYPRLLTWSSYLKNNELKTIWYGIFFGIMFAVGAYNLFLFFSFNDFSYLWYVFHLIFAILYFTGINGISSHLLFTENPETLGMLNRSFLGLMSASIALFTRSFLMTHNQSTKIDKIILALFVFSCILSLFNLIIQAKLIVNLLVLMGITVPSIMILAAWSAFKKGFKAVKLFIIAWAMFLLGVTLFAMSSGGVIPYTVFGFNGFQAGSAVAAILLSIALGDRIRLLREERASFKKSMERVSIILDSISSGIFLVDSKSKKLVKINNAAEKISGYSKRDMIGKHCWEFVCSAEKKDCPITDKCKNEDQREDVLLSAQGKNIPVLKNAQEIQLSGHDLILESFVDISDLKLAEKAVKRSEAKFRSLFESSRDAVLILDEYQFVDCNKASLNIFGCLSKKDLIGKLPTYFSPKKQPSGIDSIEKSFEYMNTAFEKGSCFFEWVHEKMNGQTFPAEVMLSEVEVEGRKMLQALVRDITRRKAMEKELKKLATTDPLTGADNRRSFLEKGAYELLRSQRYKHPFSFMMIDVDHFKDVNDTYGHHAGDQVLKKLVSHTLKTLRETDLFGRIGGEEFGAILPETDEKNAAKVGENLRATVGSIRVETDQGEIRFTISIGLAVMKESDSLVDIMGRADAALYQAKEAGRDRLVIS